MSNEAPGAAVFGFANSLLDNAALVVRIKGPSAGFLQVFDADPDDSRVEPEVHSDRLDPAVAREYMRRRKAAGFSGLCGFSCFDEAKTQLYIEAFDIRTNVGIALGGPLRRTIFGRYRPAGENAEILGSPDL